MKALLLSFLSRENECEGERRFAIARGWQIVSLPSHAFHLFSKNDAIGWAAIL
jgi:hypothetical protein